ALDDAAARSGSGADAHTQALAGFRALLIDGDAAKATALFDDAVKKNSGEPYALIGEVFIAQRSMQPQKALAASLALIEKNPKHALAPVAARVVLDTASLSLSTAKL